MKASRQSAKNQPVCQKVGGMVMSSVAPVVFQTPSSLAPVTVKRYWPGGRLL
jgi:hypothetical protein